MMVPKMRMPPAVGRQQRFSMVPQATIERSVFDRSHGYKTTFNEGLLVPFYVDEVLPGDTFNLRATMFARMTTPIKPLMDNLYLESFFFFVPYRLVWANFPKFFGEQTNPGDSTSYTVPTMSTSSGFSLGTVPDYFGLPTGVVFPAGVISDLPMRAYWLVYNQWFRDENLINSVTVITTDGNSDRGGGPALQRRGKRHDYFTSCLPWPQKGTAVALPLGTAATVVPTGTFGTGDQVKMRTATQTGARLEPSTTGSGTPFPVQGATLSGAFTAGEPLFFEQTNLKADLSTATAATINALRQAFQIQKLLERDARGGTRYIEIIKAHFGVTSPDARLQRSEYLGGGSTPVTISPIPQTSASAVPPTGVNALGGLAGVGAAVAQGHGFVKSFTEHGVLLGLVCVRADLTYSQGVERMWSRQSRYDFYWPALAHIGEQAVLNREIYADGSANDALAFGYQERYAEYRYKPSKLTNLFRPAAAGTLAVWHLSQLFASLPALNQTFIEENAPMSRVVAVTTEPHFYFDSFIKLTCARPMPVFGVPGLIDHF